MKQNDVQGAVAFFIFGAITTILSLQMPIGSLRAAGSGLFPLGLGILLMVLSAAFILKVLWGTEEPKKEDISAKDKPISPGGLYPPLFPGNSFRSTNSSPIRRFAHTWSYVRPFDDHRTSGAFLGCDRKHVYRKFLPVAPQFTLCCRLCQHPADTEEDTPASRNLVLSHRHVLGEQLDVRCLDDDSLRRSRFSPEKMGL